MGLIELASKRNHEAMDYFLRSLEAHHEIGGKFAEAAVYWNLSLTSYNLLEFEKGTWYAAESIRLYKEVGNRRRAASKLVLYPVTLIEMGRIEEATACIEEYRRDFTDVDDYKITIQLNYATGCLALSRDELRNAEERFLTALEIARENDSNEYVAQSLQNIGLIRLRQGRKDEAEDYLRKGAEALDGSEYFRNFLPDAEYYVMTGEKDEAEYFARKACARARAIGNSGNIERLEEIIRQLGISAGD
jgi:tetratricopeptide (TPR) repeat protein